MLQLLFFPSTPNLFVFQAPLHQVPNSTSFPVIIDTGASSAITPERSDFVTYKAAPQGLVLKGLAKGLRIAGEGEIQWTYNDVIFKTKGYHVPDSPSRLLSPQAHLQGDPSSLICGYCTRAHGLELLTPTGALSTIPYDSSNLPVLPMYNASHRPKQVGKAHTIQLPGFLSVIDEMNSNLSDAQKELLRYHYRLGHRNMKSLQEILKTKAFGWNDLLRRATRCPTPICSCCMFGKQHCRPVRRKSTGIAPPPSNSIRKDNVLPGQQVSIDLFSVTEGGRVIDGPSQATEVKGGCLFVDHATGYVHNEPLLNFTATEILRAKINFEVLMRSYGIIIMDYHSDNGVFNSRLLQQHLQNGEQKLTLSGVGAQFQDGLAERHIGIIISMARTMLLHAITRWDKITLSLWPFAVEYACKIHNLLPKGDGSASSIELLTGTKLTTNHLKDLHVFGAPTYVLSPTLQDGHKLPKWEARSKQGIFLGHSRKHASSVAVVLNTSSNFITPQYHVVIDDWFTTSSSPADTSSLVTSWATMFPNGLLSTQTDDPDDFVADEWLLEDELAHRRRLRSPLASGNSPPSSSPSTAPDAAPTTTPPAVLQDTSTHDHNPIQPPSPRSESQREIQQLQPNGVQPEREPPSPAPDPPRLSAPSSVQSQTPSPVLRRSNRERKPAVRFSDDRVYDQLYSGLSANVATFLNGTLMRNDTTLDTDVNLEFTPNSLSVFYGSVDETHPSFVHHATTSYGLPTLSNPDTLRYHEMLASIDRELFETAMDTEIKALESYNTWDLIKRSSVPKNAKVLPSTWTFRRKRNPDGTIAKHKARFCVRGDLQAKDPNFEEETYSPVAQATTIRLMLILTLLRKLKCTQVDYVNAFAQSPLASPVYIEAPKGFHHDTDSDVDFVLKLTKSLYGLVQAPKLFYEHLKKNLLSRGFRPSPFDPCLFLNDKVICLVYVDDCLFFSPHQDNINKVITSLQTDLKLTVEGDDVTKFLGIDYTKKAHDSYILKQVGLTKKIIETVGLSKCKPEPTPASETPLGSSEDSPAFTESWNYSSVVGMLMYLSNQTRPDITFAVNQVARFTHAPREIHAKAVKRIVRYLAGTQDQGLIFTSNLSIGLEMFCDADFAGLWKFEDPQHPNSVKSRTGFVIKLYGCPLLWTSRLQTEIAASTLEAEYIALSSGMRELIPIRGLYQSLAQHMHFNDAKCVVKCTVFEDNQGALALASAPKITPRTKHIGVKYHFFREYIISGKISLEYVPSAQQQADILTKGLLAVKFQTLRKLLCGW